MTNHPNRSKKQQAQHTPGPWQITTDEDYPHDAITAHGGETLIAEMMANGQIGLEVMANARLIAAAPETAAERDRLKALNAELLAALKLVRDEYCEGGMLDGTPAEKAISAAIAKAERR